MTNKFIIEDWAGNRLFPTEEFDTFEDGWDFIYINIDDADMYQDLYVLLKGE